MDTDRIEDAAARLAAVETRIASAAEAARLKISHVRPQGTTIDLELKEFAAAVEKATDGGIKLRIFAASALGDYTTVQERISVGAVDMACQPAARSATTPLWSTAAWAMRARRRLALQTEW